MTFRCAKNSLKGAQYRKGWEKEAREVDWLKSGRHMVGLSRTWCLLCVREQIVSQTPSHYLPATHKPRCADTPLSPPRPDPPQLFADVEGRLG
jgi:hypothetical protein